MCTLLSTGPVDEIETNSSVRKLLDTLIIRNAEVNPPLYKRFSYSTLKPHESMRLRAVAFYTTLIDLDGP